jgi:four helix bundle protein
MNERAEALRERTMRFAVEITRFCRQLIDTWDSRHVRGQLFRAATSVASNYRAACRARSRRDVISKIGFVVEESDESVFWLDFIKHAEIDDGSARRKLLDDAQQLVAIFTQSAETAGARNHQSAN